MTEMEVFWDAYQWQVCMSSPRAGLISARQHVSMLVDMLHKPALCPSELVRAVNPDVSTTITWEAVGDPSYQCSGNDGSPVACKTYVVAHRPLFTLLPAPTLVPTVRRTWLHCCR